MLERPHFIDNVPTGAIVSHCRHRDHNIDLPQAVAPQVEHNLFASTHQPSNSIEGFALFIEHTTISIIKMQFITLISSLLLLLNTGHSFSPVSSLQNKPLSLLDGSYSTRFSTAAFSSPDDKTAGESSNLENSGSIANENAITTEKAVVEPEPNPYPIDLPSPLLLSASMVLAITSTGTFLYRYFYASLMHRFISHVAIQLGSLFELTSGTPTLGFGPQVALAAIGLPSSLFLIYAAIKKGEAETEEDDRQYNKPRSF